MVRISKEDLTRAILSMAESNGDLDFGDAAAREGEQRVGKRNDREPIKWFKMSAAEFKAYLANHKDSHMRLVEHWEHLLWKHFAPNGVRS